LNLVRFLNTYTHRVLACANAADAVEVLAVGFFLTVYKDSKGEELSSLDKGRWVF
jgi:hypothetical protein